MLLKILQNSQENTCARASVLLKLQLAKRWHSCFLVNIAKFLRRPFFIEHLRWLSVVILTSSLWNQQNFSSSYFWIHLISWPSSTLWQNSCKRWYPQKNIFGSVHSYCNSNFISNIWIKIKTVWSDMYSTV